jgi:citronellol/citronellal dehydrogenase
LPPAHDAPDAPAAYRSVFAPGLFQGQTLWVTGGGSGIGRCVAHELAALGARVVLSGRKADKLQAVADEIRTDGGLCEWRSFDIRDEAAVQAAVAEVLESLGPVQGLVNNAGGQFPAPLATMRTLYLGCMAEHGGAIVNMTADFRNGMPSMGHSGAARAGMSNLTMTAAHEWGHRGVRVNAVAPGWVASSGMDTYDETMQRHIRNLRHHVPLKRLATEAEVAAVIVFLLSPAAAFVNGITVQIDGGASLGGGAFSLPEATRSSPFNGFHRAVTPKVLREVD